MSGDIQGHEAFGVLLKQARQSLGLTQSSLAERAGLSARAVQHLEGGYGSPYADTARRLADALALSGTDRARFEASARRLPKSSGTSRIEAGPAVSNSLVGRVRELGELAQLHQQRQHLHDERSCADTSLRSSESDGPNERWPAQPTPLIGRETDAVVVSDLLSQPHVRLLTLTGPAGVGKTRLAIEVAARWASGREAEALFVDLTPIDDAALVISAIARALEVEESGGEPLFGRLRQYLVARRLLLVLDNFEQVLAAALELGELLSACPDLKVLATSRTLLQLRWEHQYLVPPLAVPDLLHLPAPEVLGAAPAVSLFVERARALRPDFAVTPDNAGAVAEICVRLDGLPLAIELCAAQIDLLTSRVILDGLRRSGLDLLRGTAVDVPARHQTLRAAIGWSDRLLDTDERTLFRRLSIFVGGCTLAAAEQVVTLPGERPLAVGGGAAALVRKNLLRARQSDESVDPRLGMLEMVREYAGEQLARSGDEAEIAARHCAWCVATAEEAESNIRGPDQRAWLDHLEAEHDNLRAALSWCQLDLSRSELGLRLAGALGWFWRLHGHMTEGRRWLDATLRAREGILDPARPRALNSAGLLACGQGDYRRARQLLEESLIVAQSLGDQAAIAWAHHALGRVSFGERDLARGTADFERSIALFEELGDVGATGYSLFFWGCLLREAGDRPRARALHAESLMRARQVEDAWLLSFALSINGNQAWLAGDFATAESLYREGLVLSRDIRAKWGIAECLWGLGGLAAAQGYFNRAARLYGAERAIRVAIGAVVLGDLSRFELDMASARTALEIGPFEVLATDGRALTLEQAIAYGLSHEDAVAPAAPLPLRQGAEHPSLLTPREQEVMALIARGRSNRAIANELVISERTVEKHVANTMARLELTSRTQLAVWAHQHVSSDLRGEVRGSTGAGASESG
jgi:non-specific serine/threonine protein kinase